MMNNTYMVANIFSCVSVVFYFDSFCVVVQEYLSINQLGATGKGFVNSLVQKIFLKLAFYSVVLAMPMVR